MSSSLSDPSPARAEQPRHVILVGVGQVGQAIAARLPGGWSLTALDHSPESLSEVQALRPDARVVLGDGSSRLALERCAPTRTSVLIAATSSAEVNREAARLARLHFGVEERVVLAHGGPDGEVGADELLSPSSVIAGHVINRVCIEASRAVDIGLGQGEIQQVSVLEGSPVVGRALRDLGARTWLVAAVYRDGALIVPHGDTRVSARDRILLVGDPGDLHDVAAYFRGGSPVFPAQYGTSIVQISGPSEAGALLSHALGCGPPEPVPPSEAPLAADPAQWRRWLDEREAGCVVMAGVRLPWYVRLGLVRSRVHEAIVEGGRPVFLWPGEVTLPRRILLCVRDPRAQREVVLVGLDLARILGAPLCVLAVGANGSHEAEFARLARVYGMPIETMRSAGNPVRAIRATASPGDLVVLGVRREHNRPLSPDVSTWLLHDFPQPVLMVPWSAEVGA